MNPEHNPDFYLNLAPMAYDTADPYDLTTLPAPRTPLVPRFVWRECAAPDAAQTLHLANALDVSPLIARMLCRRGVETPVTAQEFLSPRLSLLHDPFALPDMEKAVERIVKAIEGKETVFVHGDYDTDGVTSAALAVRALEALGVKTVGFVPRRSDGYDLQMSGVDRAHEAGASLILTTDCGSCALAPIAYARERGLDVIVTDHHRPGPVLPDACAIVNPYREDFDITFRALCGAGVVYKLFDAVYARVKPELREAYRHNFADLAALGTIADMTPLVSENRAIVAYGLEMLAAGKKTGLFALLKQVKMLNTTLSATRISWSLTPKLNAAGRMEDAHTAYRLLTTRDPDEAEALTVQLMALSEQSSQAAARATTEAVEEALGEEHQGRRVLVLARETWGKGVMGLAANRVVEAMGRPVILLSHDPTPAL